MTANAIDWITLPEAKTALNITASTWDTELEVYITAVSQTLDLEVGPVVKRNITESRDGGCRSIWLFEVPVAAVTTVVEYDGTTPHTLTAESNTVKTAYNYSVDLETGRVGRRASNMGWAFPAGKGNVVITYSAGRYDATTDVASHFKLAAEIMLASTWRVEQGAGTQTFGTTAEPVFGDVSAIPERARQFLRNDLKAPLVG